MPHPGDDDSRPETAADVDADFDAAVQALIPGYLAKRKQDLAAMREALPRGDFAVLMDLAHRLAGTGASYGFDALSWLGFALEAAAESRQPHRIAGLLDALEAALADASALG